LINLGSAVGYLLLDTTGFKQGFNSALADLKVFEKQTATTSDKLIGLGSAMKSSGAMLSKNVTLPLVGAGLVASKFSVSFESAFAGVRKTVDATEEEFDALEQGILSMTRVLPASSEEIAGVAEAAGQLGIKTESILSFTRTMIDLGESTNMSAEEAATALARLANITGMSQDNFDRLGSVIVDLGNNLATTEAEIVEMGLRLSGAGKQVGLTEAEILSFAGALSSVGIEAQAGGTAFSKVMVEMQLAAEVGGEKLDQFANVAGMSAEQFKTAFQEDAAQAMITFIEGLSNAEDRGISAIKMLDDMGISEVRLRDALLRASGASELFNESLDIGTKAWEENLALTKEAEQRYETSESQMRTALNTLKEAGIIIGDLVVPHLVDLVNYVKDGAIWFSNLNPEVQESIVKFAAITAALGPVLLVGGKVVGVVGSLVGAFAKFSAASAGATAATAGITGATGAASGGMAIFGGALKAAAFLINPWTLAIAGAGLATYGLYKHLSSDAIPAVQLFGDEVSESTQEAVGGFIELRDKATMELNQLKWSGQRITDEMATDLVSQYNNMGNQILNVMRSSHEERLNSTQEFFERSSILTAEEEAIALEKMQRYQAYEQDSVQYGQDRIKEILETAAEEKREITDREREIINNIQENMTTKAVEYMSESEVEQKAIMNRLRESSSEITALQAAEIVKNSRKQTDETIQNAHEQYIRTVEEIEYLRDEVGSISEEQAAKLIDEAQQQTRGAITAAEEMHQGVVSEAKKQSKEHINEVDWETGEIRSKWAVLKDNTTLKAKEIKESVIKDWNDLRARTSLVWQGLKNDASIKYEELKEMAIYKVQQMKEGIILKWKELRDDTITWGKNLIDGLWNGITEKAQWLDDKVNGFIEGIKNTFTRGFDMNSPSRVTEQYGSWFTEGFAKGIENNLDAPKSAVDTFVEEVNNPLESSIKSLVDTVDESMKEVNDNISSTVSILEKEFELWKAKNLELAGSSEELTRKLTLQGEQQTYLETQITETKQALSDIIVTYGETSSEALRYKNNLLDLQIEHAKLTNTINENAKAYDGLAESAMAARIKDFESLSEEAQAKSRKRYNDSRDRYYDQYKEEIDALSRSKGVDVGVAQEMHRNNIINNINITTDEPLDSQGVVREIKKVTKDILR
jgi:TP901 family phage tail tape measure protein